ncbi:MAG: hypothetical protein ACXAC5_01515 [Promethearchaeota archaeon]|jgi:hypothetical protein
MTTVLRSRKEVDADSLILSCLDSAPLKSGELYTVLSFFEADTLVQAIKADDDLAFVEFVKAAPSFTIFALFLLWLRIQDKQNIFFQSAILACWKLAKTSTRSQWKHSLWRRALRDKQVGPKSRVRRTGNDRRTNETGESEYRGHDN